MGSSIGHAVGSLFTGGGSEKPQEASPQAQQQQYDSQPQSLYSDAQPMDAGLYSSSASHEDSVCANDVRAFRKCMDDEKGNLSICGWYLDQLVCPLFPALVFQLPPATVNHDANPFNRKHANLPRDNIKLLIFMSSAFNFQ